ncbi:glycosyl hydrolase family 18 protein [Paenibacillus sp. FJAT-26967]|uniref:glycosyl hydrolase family 18 protein n=1 Tax=Paenibacillus sp. FJAT-26967 TaxID=1729690 RepID=UPI0008392793|nr:glycosyl hydrolase family 18 protein [Paenibacillus sp. FJAT-26967]
MKAMRWILTGAIVVSLVTPLGAQAADKTTKYRVYQNNKILVEMSDYEQAKAYAQQFKNSYVEDISSRNWLWNNFPRYQVFQYDATLPEWTFSTLEAAITEARRWGHASVRDLQSGGWAWNNYPKYRVYQGDNTLSGWEFLTLDEAKNEARKWRHSHILDLNSNTWIWDNISDADKKQMRAGKGIYQVYQGTTTDNSWNFAYLEDAVAKAVQLKGSSIIRASDNKVIYQSEIRYKVYQNDVFLSEFVSLADAQAYAARWAHSEISLDGKIIWSNYPYYQVLQNNSLIGDFNTIPKALEYAKNYSNTTIRTLDRKVIWDNLRKLQYWGWTGSSAAATVQAQAAATTGLDVVSPTYFQLMDATGKVDDKSDAATVELLKKQGFTVYPLINNQFNAQLTTAFLADQGAVDRFIKQIVDKAAQLKVDGLNLDFESLDGKDRERFSAFVKKFADAARQKKLNVSIDLPRGSIKWNAKTAFDHEKLASYVDYVVIMAYDQYYKGSTEPGSVSGLPWAEQGVIEFLSYGIPRDKLIMGIPYYVRDWTLDAAGKLVANKTVLLKDIPKLMTEKKAVKTWDNEFKQYRVEYTENGQKHVFWLEDHDTVKQRLGIAHKYDLAGVAAWRLGYDTPELWNMMLQEK